MLGQLVEKLVASRNEAADDILLEALRLGSEPEKSLALDALLRRQTVHGLNGVVSQCFSLSPSLETAILNNIGSLHPAIRQCARGGEREAAISAIRLIALGRQGKLTYLLTEALHGVDEAVARTAAEALVSLTKWVARETRRLGFASATAADEKEARERAKIYAQLMDERPEIEQAVARVMDVNRGRFGPELLRAALLMADSTASKTLAILNTPKHGGQPAMIRRLQQPPEAEFVEAFLLAASHATVRSTFGVVFGHIVEPATLDALLGRSHWLKDHQLQLCMRQVTRGVWCGETDLDRDLSRRDSRDVALVAEWIAASGLHDVVQDQKLEKSLRQLEGDASGRLRLLRIAMGRRQGASVELLRGLLTDPDERLARLAAREIARRRPPDYENMLMQAMSAGVADSVRRVIGRSVGQAGFDLFWERWDRLDRPTRRSAGRAVLKLLPDGVAVLDRRLRNGPVEQRLKAIAMAQELGVADQFAGSLQSLCSDANPKVRSKAVMAFAHGTAISPETILDRVLTDEDPRVRANAIEVIEARHRVDYIPLLTQRARQSHNRERANAIRALHRLRVGTASQQLLGMLKDDRAEHRISAIWALRQIGWWQMLHAVGQLAREDTNLRVRRYALNVLRGASEMLAERKNLAG